jgi:hypothetical protein
LWRSILTKFPVFTRVTGNWAPETGSLETVSSSGGSLANLPAGGTLRQRRAKGQRLAGRQRGPLQEIASRRSPARHLCRDLSRCARRTTPQWPQSPRLRSRWRCGPSPSPLIRYPRADRTSASARCQAHCCRRSPEAQTKRPSLQRCRIRSTNGC